MFLDGKLLLDGIPLVQGAWAGASPEVLVRTTWAAARIEDFEARYKDLVLRPKTSGEEVSQSLAKDSFEGYPAGAFPDQGGWRAPGAQTTDPASSIGLDTAKSLSSREGGGRSDGLPRRPWPDGQRGQAKPSSRPMSKRTSRRARPRLTRPTSATGLRSLLIETDGKDELIVVKRLSLPARVPFGVSEGNFTIGAAQTVAQGQIVSRSRLMDGQRLKGKVKKPIEMPTGPGRGRREETSSRSGQPSGLPAPGRPR